MAYGEENDFGWSNIVVKFLLFGTNMVVWVSESRCERSWWVRGRLVGGTACTSII